MDLNMFFQGLTLLGSLGFLVVVYYALRLSKETENEKHWLVLALSAIFLAMDHWALIPWELHLITDDARFVIQQASAIIGAALFAYAIYGLFTSMKKIREKMR